MHNPQGSKVIMSPASKTYLDIKYNSSTELGQNWAGLYRNYIDSCNWDPAKLINGIKEDNIPGVAAALWTESIKKFPILNTWFSRVFALLRRLADPKILIGI